MGRPLIVVGDKTSHGGTVIEGTSMTDAEGKLISCVGHKVTCPRKGHGTNSIVTGDPTLIIDGKPAARHGDTTGCGATLISSQIATNSDPMGGDDNDAGSAMVAGAAASSLTASEQSSHDLHFLVQDEVTGKPLANIPYKITLENGKSVEGKTDEHGLTQKISDNSATIATLEAPYYGDSTSSSNSNNEHSACSC